MLGGIDANTIITSVESPEKTYYAEIVNSDQGATGGSTFVNVYERKSFDLPILKVYKKLICIEEDDWRSNEFETMKLDWKDDQILVINKKRI